MARRRAKKYSYLFPFLISLVVLSFLVAGYFLTRSPQKSKAVTTLRLGIMSDSSSDEYRADDNRAGSTAYEQTTLSWVELLARYRSVDVGAWGINRGLPRRTGFEYNWARSGATSGSLISQGQHTGMATQVSQGLVDLVYLSIGGNDFAYYYTDAQSIYNGTLSGDALTSKINGVVANITTALDTVLNASPTIKVIVATIPDMGNNPTFQAQYPDPVKRQRVTDAIKLSNTGVRAMLASRPRATLFDVEPLTQEVLAMVDQQTGMATIGGVDINFAVSGDSPDHAILGDGIHSGTVFGAVFLNELLPYINTVAGTSIAPLTDSEMLRYAGIIPADVITLTKSVSSGADDVNEQGSKFSTSGSIPLGGDANNYSGFRFSNVAIPANAQIYQAYIEVYSPTSSWISVNYRMWGEATGNSSPFTSSSKPSLRVPTESWLPYSPEVHWSANTWHKLPIVTPIVQEIVNRSDWQSGNAMSFVTRGLGTKFATTNIRSTDQNASQAPRLVIQYVSSGQPVPTYDPSPVPTASPITLPSPIPTPFEIPSPTPEIPSPTPVPTPLPTLIPSPLPTVTPTPVPTATPSAKTVRLVAKPNGTTQNYTIFDGIVENNATTTEVTSARFTYSSGWTASGTSGVNNSAFRYAVSAGPSVTFTTTATSLQIQTAMHPQVGSIDVYVNNGYLFTFNGNASALTYVTFGIPL